MLESIRYNSDAGFTLQYHLALASVSSTDEKRTATAKIGVVADFLDVWLNLRLWNNKSNNYSPMHYAIFQEIKNIRRKPLSEIKKVLHNRLTNIMEDLDFSTPVTLNQFTSKAIHRQLARFIDWLEQRSGETGQYEKYINRSGKNAYEIEHIWENHYDRFTDEFDQQTDFERARNQIGGLLLLPKKINASLSDMAYKQKIEHYIKENLLTQSLHETAYEKNPGFVEIINNFGLPFRSHDEFKLADLSDRSKLYCLLAKIIWSTDRLR